jgi:L-amino acid N-acyltransferase YncA
MTELGASRGPSIDELRLEDWPAVRAIYEQGIATRQATFETDVPAWAAWDAAHLPLRLVAREGGAVVGWAALSPSSSRPVYAGVAWASTYVADGARGRGIGHALLSALVERSEAEGFWTLQAGVFPENAPSVRLHESCGFRLVGVRERLGQLDGVWRDVLLFERRSPVVY